MRTGFFESWLILAESRQTARGLDKFSSYAMRELARLEDYLDDPGPQKPLMDFVPRVLSRLVAYQFSRSQLEWIEELYLRVSESRSPGATHVQEQLLEVLAHARHASTIPFWVKMVDYRTVGEDGFQKQRQTFALAALALIAINKNNSQACEALLILAQNEQPEVRELAVYYLGKVPAWRAGGRKAWYGG